MKRSLLHLIGLVGMVVWIGLPALAAAQTAELPFHKQAYFWNSAVHNGTAETFLAESHRVNAPSAPWLRLYFGEANLGTKSYLVIKSLQDGAWQRLDANSFKQWYNTSAYFNGDAVEVQLHVASGDGGVFLQIKEVVVGEWVSGIPQPESQCGPTDDRVPSNHPASGRLLNVGCTGWIVTCPSNNLHVTAGHCSGGTATLQFNVPPSDPDGTINNPPPQDQYSVNTATWNFVNGGIGNDWGTFAVFPNSITGLLPAQAQGSAFIVKQDLDDPVIRITGFGVDFNDPTRNQTQQTHAGPNAASSGTTMRYQTDTEGGNSGSPVIDDATGQSVGVHTHGGCTTGGTGNNSGTSLFNTAFWNAINNACGGGGGCNNIALGKPATASSTNGNNVPGRAVDGNTTTFWRSGGGGTQWLQVDLGTGALSYSTWEIVWRGERYAINYEIRVSNSATFATFTTVFSTTSGNGGTDTGGMTDAPRTERYVRLHATVPNAGHYRVAEFRICSSTSAASKSIASESEATVVPKELALHANYPNPFNPSTTISFSLPEAAHVTLKVYNLIGEEVATLVNERRDEGNHSVLFDAGLLPSGVYFSVLNVGDVRLVRRLVLMK